MRIIALLSFYDEPIESLVSCVASLKLAGVDHLVAVDGAYALYPGGEGASDVNQHGVIAAACREVGIGCTLHTPTEPWVGNEVEKRTFLFAMGWTIAKQGDWFFVMDADQVITSVPGDFRERLERTEHPTAEVTFIDVLARQAQHPQWPEEFNVRCLFKAQPIRVEKNHITYVNDRGALLWGWSGDERPLEGFLALRDLLVEHHPQLRPAERQSRKLGYYNERDGQAIERDVCYKCGDPAIVLVAADWYVTDIGPCGRWKECCEDCAEARRRASSSQLWRLGIDPSLVVIENRNGVSPAQVTHA